MPIRLPSTTLPVVPESEIYTPSPPLPEMTLRGAGAVPPIVLSLAPSKTDTPFPSCPRRDVPVAVRPMSLPSTTLPSVPLPSTWTPSDMLPEITLPVPGGRAADRVAGSPRS